MCVCSPCSIPISGKIIKEMPGLVASGTHCASFPKSAEKIQVTLKSDNPPFKNSPIYTIIREVLVESEGLQVKIYYGACKCHV